MEWRLETGEFDHLIVEADGLVYAEYSAGGSIQREQIMTPRGKPLKLGWLTGIGDFRSQELKWSRPDNAIAASTRYKIKHR